MNLADHVGETVILYGLADNTKAGPVLRCGPTTHVYLDGCAQWTEAERYTGFELTGTLTEVGDERDLQDDDGMPIPGIGKHYVVTDARWTPLSAGKVDKHTARGEHPS